MDLGAHLQLTALNNRHAPPAQSQRRAVEDAQRACGAFKGLTATFTFAFPAQVCRCCRYLLVGRRKLQDVFRRYIAISDVGNRLFATSTPERRSGVPAHKVVLEQSCCASSWLLERLLLPYRACSKVTSLRSRTAEDHDVISVSAGRQWH